MSVIIVLIIISIFVAGSFLAAFLWAVRSGQYEDTDSPAVRILFDDKKSKKLKVVLLFCCFVEAPPFDGWELFTL